MGLPACRNPQTLEARSSCSCCSTCRSRNHRPRMPLKRGCVPAYAGGFARGLITPAITGLLRKIKLCGMLNSRKLHPLPPSLPQRGRTVVMTKKLLHNESAPIRWLRDRYRRHLHAAVCAILRDQHRGCPAGTSVCVCVCVGGGGGLPTPSEGAPCRHWWWGRAPTPIASASARLCG